MVREMQSGENTAEQVAQEIFKLIFKLHLAASKTKHDTPRRHGQRPREVIHEESVYKVDDEKQLQLYLASDFANNMNYQDYPAHFSNATSSFDLAQVHFSAQPEDQPGF